MSKMPKATLAHPWSPAVATKQINAKARDDAFDIALKTHAREQMAKRGLVMGDVLHVLKHGFVYDQPEPGTTKGSYKYKIQTTTPNSKGRDVRVVVIPQSNPAVVVITVMWADEKSTHGN